MCAVFTKKSDEATYFDGASIRDGMETRNFTAKITVHGSKADEAIQGGRITEFMLCDEGDNANIICLYKNGKWIKRIDPSDGMANYLLSHFVAEYNSETYKSWKARYLHYLSAAEGESAGADDELPF